MRSICLTDVLVYDCDLVLLVQGNIKLRSQGLVQVLNSRLFVADF